MSSSALFTRDHAASRPFVIAMSVIGSVALVAAAVIASALMGRSAVPTPVEADPLSEPDPEILSEARDLVAEAEALRLENLLLREQGQRIAANGQGTRGGLANVPRIDDPAAEEAVELARSLRNSGDMAGALAQLRTAQKKIGDHPRILYAMADVYQAMGLTAKATQAWETIRATGTAAGDYYEMAILRLGFTDPAFTPARPDNSIFIGRASVHLDDNLADGERVVVRLSLQSRSRSTLEVPKVYIDIQFYDLINGLDIDVNRNKLDADSWNWATQPVDWKDGEELLDITYFLSEANAKKVPGERRQYYGFVAKLYYKDRLQDVYMHPRTLHEDILRKKSGSKPRGLEASLFPE